MTNNGNEYGKNELTKEKRERLNQLRMKSKGQKKVMLNMILTE